MFDITYAGAFGAGLISFVSPCILPIVPPYLCFLAGVSFAELEGTGARGAPSGDGEGGRALLRWRVVLAALLFALGFATVFVALGATASSVGQALSRHYDVLRWIAGGVILVMGLHFLGLFRISFLYRDLRFQSERRPATLAGAYLIGLAFAFGWTPCVGPVLAAVLFTAGAQETAAEGAALLGAYAAGMGLPFVAAALFAGPFIALMRRFRAHLGTVEKAMGALLVLTGILFISNQVSTVAGWLLTYMPALG